SRRLSIPISTRRRCGTRRRSDPAPSPSRLVLPSGFLRSFGPKLRECQRDGECHEREDRAMITLYSYPSPNGHKASIMLEETGLPYETVRVDVTMGENLEPGFLAISPL